MGAPWPPPCRRSDKKVMAVVAAEGAMVAEVTAEAGVAEEREGAMAAAATVAVMAVEAKGQWRGLRRGWRWRRLRRRRR